MVTNPLSPLLLLLLTFSAGIKELPSPVDIWKNFDPDKVLENGFMAQNREGRWYVRVWANQDVRDDCAGKLHSKDPESNIPCTYTLLLSVRNTREKAIHDGNQWMKDAAKKVKEKRK